LQAGHQPKVGRGTLCRYQWSSIVAKPGRPPVLDEGKQREIVAILSMGCSRRTAAQYVGCDRKTIQNTAERNKKFAEKLERAQSQAVVTHVKNINSAAKKAQYWRAAAWALERLNPEEYATPHPDMISLEQVSRVIDCFAQIVIEAVPVDAYRKSIIKRLGELTKMVNESVPCKPGQDVSNIEEKNIEHK
jgi:hypothetical protein